LEAVDDESPEIPIARLTAVAVEVAVAAMVPEFVRVSCPPPRSMPDLQVAAFRNKVVSLTTINYSEVEFE
jgi:hypothetical protein